MDSENFSPKTADPVARARTGGRARRISTWLLALALFLHTFQSSRVLKPAGERVRENVITYGALMAVLRHKGRLDRDRQLSARVRLIESRIAAAAMRLRPAMRNVPWEVHVVSGFDNALNMGDGKLAVGDELVRKLRLSDDELAFILGHETAHVLHDDVTATAVRDDRIEGVIRAIECVLGFHFARVGTVEIIATLFVRLPASRREEEGADVLGIELARRAGYDPHGALSYFEKSRRIAPDAWDDSVLSDHPTTASRIEHTRALLVMESR